jgi:ATP-binding cassette subfamily B protein
VSAAGALAWPVAQLGEALWALCRQSGLAPRGGELAPLPAEARAGGGEALERFLAASAARLGVEVEPAEAAYGEVEALLSSGGPALLLPGGEGRPVTAIALLAGGTRRRARVLAPDLAVREICLDELRAELLAPLEAPLAGEIDRLLETAAVPPRRRPAARRALLEERLSGKSVSVFLVRPAPNLGVWARFSAEGGLRQLALFVAAHALQHGLFWLAFVLIARGALAGRADPGMLLGAALALLSVVPLRAAVVRAEGGVALLLGSTLRQRLLHGALGLDPDAIRSQGIGRLLGRVLEADALESLLHTGGLLALTSFVELVLALFVLAAGAGGLLHAMLLVVWTAITAWIGHAYLGRRRAWQEGRLTLTYDLIERMLGHRTRLAQEPAARAHDDEDQALARHLDDAARMDRATARLIALPSRGFLLVGWLGLLPALLGGTATRAALSVGIGGILAAYLALRRLSTSLWALSDALLAWERVAELVRAEGPDERAPAMDVPAAAADGSVPLVEAKNLVFRRTLAGAPVLREVSLRIAEGDRLLLEGPSGGGKSTLSALLAGLRTPTEGLLLFRGLDGPSLGRVGLRRLVAAAPQFHDNHVLASTFAFNLLMGRAWPPRAEDLAEAEKVCRELGLGDLLDRMPSGMMQMVGEKGWRLSHGEQSRLFVARALLAGVPLVILDESFAALDPDNLRRCMECVLSRARAVLLVAHP